MKLSKEQIIKQDSDQGRYQEQIGIWSEWGLILSNVLSKKGKNRYEFDVIVF